MRASSIPLGYLLVFAVAVSVAIAAYPWVTSQMSEIIEKTEINNVRNDFVKCARKILEVARTGSTQKCVFSASRGDLFVRREGIYYRLISNHEICFPHGWSTVSSIDQLQQRCLKKNLTYIYELRWFYPKNDTVVLEGRAVVKLPSGTKEFSLSNKGFLNVEFESPEGLKGKTIEITRKVLERDKAVLTVKIY